MSVLEPQGAMTSLPIDYDKRLMLFSGRATPQLARTSLESSASSSAGQRCKTFSNGEVYCRYEESIRGADVFIVQSTCGNAREGLTANDALMELLVMIDAAVGASAHRVIAVMPWFGYSRQDKKSAPREPISARLVARMLEAAGADRVLTMDLHAGQVQGFFSKPVDHMTARFILAQHFNDLHLEDLVVVAPDVGRAKLAQKFAENVGADLAVLTKERPAQQVAEIGYVIGDVRGKTRSSSTTSSTPPARFVRRPDVAGAGSAAGLRRCDARGLLRPGLREPRQHAASSGSSSPTPCRCDPLRRTTVIQLPCAELLTDSIRRIFTDGSVSEVFGGENQLF
jgi:ribose-phosphate pyrophosphokinase